MPDNRKRSITLTIRLTPGEKDTIVQKATILGLALGTAMALSEEEEIEEQEYVNERYAEEENRRGQGMGGM